MLHRSAARNYGIAVVLSAVFSWRLPGTAAQDAAPESKSGSPPDSVAPESPRLKYPPPKLDSPQTITLKSGQTSTKLDPNRDYIIKLPAETKVGCTELIGGRNVVILGGHVTVPGSEPQKEPKIAHFSAFHFKHQTGTVHIEGVLIDNSAGGKGWDAFFTNCPQAIVQIQNVRVEGLSGDFKGFHADIFQTGHGVRELRMDRLTGTTDYQGLFLKIEESLRGKNRFGDLHFSRINLEALPGTFNQALLYLATPDYYMEGHVYLEEVYLKPVPTFARDFIVPRVTPCGLEQMRTRKCDHHFAWKEGSKITWPYFEQVHGSVIEGAPEEDFVPAGSVGLDYRPAESP